MLLSPQSKICILYRIKYPSYKQVCCSSFLQDDECFATQTNSRLRILSYKQPTTRFRIIFHSKIHIPCGIEYPSITKFAFLALFRMMSVLEVKSNSRFGRSPIIYPVTGILGVPSFLLPIMTSVPLWSQIFLSLLPVCLVTSHFFVTSPGKFSFTSPQESACVSPMDLFSFGILFPSVSPSPPSEFLQSVFCFFF